MKRLKNGYSHGLGIVAVFTILLTPLICFSCSVSNNQELVWNPFDYLPWGMSFSAVEEALGNDALISEEGVTPNRYFLDEEDEIWGLTGQIKLDFKGFDVEDEKYLTAFVFVPDEDDAGKVEKELSKVLRSEGKEKPAGTPTSLSWESPQTAKDIMDEDLRKKVQTLTEKIWQNSLGRQTELEMESPLVTVTYYLPTAENKGWIEIDGERASIVAIAKEGSADFLNNHP